MCVTQVYHVNHIVRSCTHYKVMWGKCLICDFGLYNGLTLLKGSTTDKWHCGKYLKPKSKVILLICILTVFWYHFTYIRSFLQTKICLCGSSVALQHGHTASLNSCCFSSLLCAAHPFSVLAAPGHLTHPSISLPQLPISRWPPASTFPSYATLMLLWLNKSFGTYCQ